MYSEEIRRLKYRGDELYRKYFFNPNKILTKIILDYDNNGFINEDICETVLDVSDENYNDLLILFRYYPRTLTKIKYINDNVVNDLMNIYGETIEIIEENIFIKNKANPRKVLFSRITMAGINREEIILPRRCPVFGFKLDYNFTKTTPYSVAIMSTYQNSGVFFVCSQSCVKQVIANKPKKIRKKRLKKPFECNTCGVTDEKLFKKRNRSKCCECSNKENRIRNQKKYNYKPRKGRQFKCVCGESDPTMFGKGTGKYCIKCSKRRAKERYQLLKPKLIKDSAKWSLNHIIEFRLLSIKHRAYKNGKEFNIDFNYVVNELAKLNYKVVIVDTNEEIYHTVTNIKIDNNRLSIRLIDKEKGYIPENIKVKIR